MPLHEEETLISICLDKKCSSYFEAVCSVCIQKIHPEHALTQFVGIKSFLNKIADLI